MCIRDRFTPAGAPYSLALAVQNIGPPSKLIEEESPMPLLARAGAAVLFDIEEGNKLLVALDYVQPVYSYGYFSFGLEDNLLDVLFIRAGTRISVDTRTPPEAAAGVGVSLKQFDVRVGINYSYKAVFWSQDNFDSTHIIGVQLTI
mgnify:CR=1 FL=1